MRPSSDMPDWKITGWPCGERERLSGPATLKCSPTWSSAWSLEGVEEDAAFDVGRERVVLVGVPQAARRPRRILRPPVASGVVEVLVETEGQRLQATQVVRRVAALMNWLSTIEERVEEAALGLLGLGDVSS